MSNIKELFKEPIYIVDGVLNNKLSSLHKNCKDIADTYQSYSDKWNPGTAFVSISKDIQPHKDDVGFGEVTDIMFTHAKQFMDDLGFSYHQKKKLFVTRSWFNISYKEDYLERHVHPGTLFSAVFYIETGIDDKILFVRNAYEMMDRPNNMNEWSETVRYFDCIPGRLILFKGNVMHGVNKQVGGIRNVIVYNFALKNT